MEANDSFYISMIITALVFAYILLIPNKRRIFLDALRHPFGGSDPPESKS